MRIVELYEFIIGDINIYLSVGMAWHTSSSKSYIYTGEVVTPDVRLVTLQTEVTMFIQIIDGYGSSRCGYVDYRPRSGRKRLARFGVGKYNKK